ncbi:MAG: M1 family metallopeptidase [Planctomycetota bacterium]|jgi:hypothetical protein|nr:M1 family metallopeptidase [Planctomycetota bacterium]
MRKRTTILSFLVAILLPGLLVAQLSYDIDIELDEDGRTISGRSLVVSWVNPTNQATDELYWHVYNNAWSSKDSVFLKEGRFYGSDKLPREWGSTEVFNASQLSTVDVAGNVSDSGVELNFEYVDESDRTVGVMKLPQAIEPGASVQIRLEFTSIMPQAFRRSGWGEGGYLHAVQWYPKLGVYEELDGEVQWNCEPYHYMSEFYADFADYDVELVLPERFRDHCVTTGTLREVHNVDGKVVYSSVAENVHDFAWTVDAEALLLRRTFHAVDYRDDEQELKISNALGLPLKDVRPQSCEMILLLQPEHTEYANRYFDATAKSLYYFGLWYGTYPYETISIVDPANNARQTGGMEYPRLFTGGVSLGMAARTLRPQGVTVHEFGHQFWYGLVANDEFRHAWLDEGFTTFSTNRVLDLAFERPLNTYTFLGQQYYGRAPMAVPKYAKGDKRGFLNLNRWENSATRYFPELSYELRHNTSALSFMAELPFVSYYPYVEKSATIGLRSSLQRDWGQQLAHPTYDLFESGLRGVNAYRRPALMLETISRLVGDDVFIRLMRDYHTSYRYKHPRPQDFFDIVAKHASDSKIDWQQFWEHAYYQNHELDFSAHYLKNQEIEDGNYHVEIGLRRRGEFVLEVDVEVSFENGEKHLYVWDGVDSAKRIDLGTFPSKAVRLEIDPQRKLMLDSNWLNNSKLASGAETDDNAWNIAVRTMLWAQQVLHYFGGAG